MLTERVTIKRVIKSIFLILSATVLVVAFQNCSIEQNSGLLGSRATAEQIATQIADRAPFAYDLSSDTISYNSCVGEGLNSYGLHGLKIGINEGFIDNQGTGNVKGGLKLTTDFLKYVAANLKPPYPSTVITPGQISRLLSRSTINSNLHIQYAVRRRNNLSVVVDQYNRALTPVSDSGRDGVFFYENIWMDPIASRLTKYVQYSPDGTILSEGRRVYNLQSDAASPTEASFGFSHYLDPTMTPKPDDPTDPERFGYGEEYSEMHVRKFFNSANPDKFILTQTYGPASTQDSSASPLTTPLRVKGQETNLSKAYGRGYMLSFASPSALVPGWVLKTQLRNVTEFDLATSQPIGSTSWQCLNVVIMKQNQWNGADHEQASCAPLLAIDLTDPVRADRVQKIRRHYSEENWDIGLFYRAEDVYDPLTRYTKEICLVPKTTECYLRTDVGEIDSKVKGGVQYDQTKECYLYNFRLGGSYSEPTDLASLRKLGRCAQYASICTRTTTGP